MWILKLLKVKCWACRNGVWTECEALPFDGASCRKQCKRCGTIRRACNSFITVEGGADKGWERNVCETCGSEQRIVMGTPTQG